MSIHLQSSEGNENINSSVFQLPQTLLKASELIIQSGNVTIVH